MVPIRVVVQGVLGKMGQQVLSMVCDQAELSAVAGVDQRAEHDSILFPDGSGTVKLTQSLKEVIVGADVVVDFTGADGAFSAIKIAAENKVNLVIGSTGSPESTLRKARSLAEKHEVGILIAPNFALGAVLMVHLAKQAAPFFDYSDLSESHNEAKVDAPSGTAIAIANAAYEGKGSSFTAPSAEKEIVQGTRGGVYGGTSIHSARMPGRVAHHEIMFGAVGQTLTIRHDSVSRESFMPGVLMAIRHVVANPGLVVGLDKIMGL